MSNKRNYFRKKSPPDGGLQGGGERSDLPLHSEQSALPMRRIKTGSNSRVSENCRDRAVKLLARREHSRAELLRKLTAKGWQVEEINSVLDELSADHLQDDQRFAAAYIRYRSEAGYGPRRISAELAERGIKSLPDNCLDENNPQWLEILKTVWQKKFNQPPEDLKTKAKQINFLMYRGFTYTQVDLFFKEARML